MSQEINNFNEVYDLFKNHIMDLSALLELIQDYNGKLDKYFEEFEYLKKELAYLKEFYNKHNEFLVLELESNLDKHNQLQINQNLNMDSYFNEIIKALKEENKMNIDKLCTINEELGGYKQSLNENNKSIAFLNDKISSLEKTLIDKDNYIDFLENESKTKNVQIESLKEEINILNSIITEKNETINSLEGM